ncbi:Uncharacterized protein FKW44_007979, partial [Caligus rogercresseyi]
RDHQIILATHDLVNYLQLPSLTCLAHLIFNNKHVGKIVAKSSHEGKTLIDRIITFLNRDKRVEIQLASARCISYLNRTGILSDDDPKVIYKALPC